MLSGEAMTVLNARYLREGETPEKMFWRVAEYVAEAEAFHGGDKQAACQEYYDIMAGLEFLPNSPTLMNAGRKQAQMAACFVLPVDDSLGDIFDTLKHAALIHQSGGGTGFSFSRIRPKGDRISGTNGLASGPVSFLHVYDAATEVVRQGAVRRGANMAVLRVDHPDIEEFITVKRDRTVLNNFNLSVGITDAFMAAVAQDRSFALVHPRTGRTVRQVPARRLFDLMAAMAWENGEPGLFFLDTVNRANPTPHLGIFEAPNPCSEQPLLAYESCVLGSVNLAKMVAADGQGLDYDRLSGVVRRAVRFLDNVIDRNWYPLPAVAEATLRTRKIGLGIMGLADLFIMLDIPYGSKQAVLLTADIMRFITAEARRESARLAAKRGPFPAYPGSIYEHSIGPVRNATVTTIAPTGTISIIANCSSGIEPLFALAFSRHVLGGQVLASINPTVLAYLDKRGLLTADVEEAIKRQGSVRNTGLAYHVKQVLATAHEIRPVWHVAHLAAAQRYTDNAVSKTVNLPHKVTPQDVARIFSLAYRSGCKGVTVYRDGSRNQQVLVQGVAANCPLCQE
ncbi:adenosylcobalamin-dependent ribonucleoside-diphosphate reductase [Sporolituus thermophilus]|uniref:Vitamin B12-dependent ribonucleotide reductase n=1 Tax=Sporolituus thermophilus DSM 23256 TaxID=1123285 RepID=A0A1G7MA17_9FIRM|nr:adenosylcobalamin-dependent ribonucleoside-diphosphate reductase [Sporolituus thermophilus]SDF58577.1 ribonucleoside-diphosphate reductase class II [Sporolituus thermophilus DSM 23256]